MNLFYRNRLLFWILVILAVINLSALATFLLYRRAPETKPAPAVCCADGSKPCTILRSELGLTGAQSEQVAAINRHYTDSANPVAAAIKQKRGEILNALDETRPDTVELNQLLLQLGTLQAKLQKASIRQYSELRKVCTPEQAHRLSALYRDLYGCPMKEEQGRHRYRHGSGSGGGKCE